MEHLQSEEPFSSDPYFRNLVKGREGPEQSKFGTGWTGIAKIGDGTRDKMGQSRKGRSKTGKLCSKIGNLVIFIENF